MLSTTEETLSVLSTHELQSNIESFCLLELIYKLILSRLFQNFSSKKEKKEKKNVSELARQFLDYNYI